MKPRAFVSAVSSELSQAREHVAHKLRAMGFDVDTEEDWRTKGGNLLSLLQKMVSGADVFVQLVGRYPGAAPQPADPRFPGSSFTQLEFRYARQAQTDAQTKPVIYLFLTDPEVSNDVHATPTPDELQFQERYRDEIRGSGLLSFNIANTPSLLDKITELDYLHELIRNWFDVWKAHGGPPLARPAESAGGLRGFSLATLHYSNRWLPWQPRPDEEQALKRFLGDERPFLWWVITGEGGVGKSRLAQELMLRKDNDGWVFGTLSPNDPWWDGNAAWVPDGRVLIVSDYAASRRNWTDALFGIYHKLETKGVKASVRVLLLTRPDGFTSFLKGNANDERFKRVKSVRYIDAPRASASDRAAAAGDEERLILRTEALEVKPVDSSLRDALLRVLESIAGPDAKEVARLTRDVPDLNQSAYWDSLRTKTGGGRWLLLQIYGWLYSLKQREAKRGERSTDFEVAQSLETLLKAFLVREIRSNWTSHRGHARSGEDEDTDRILSVLATATIQQGLDRAVFEKLPAVQSLTAKRRGILWRRCQSILGGDQHGERLSAVEPDLAGEALVVQALSTLGWDADAPGDGYFVPSYDKKSALVGPLRVVRHALKSNRGDGLAHFLGLIGRDFVNHEVTFKLFDVACKLALFNRHFHPTDNLLAGLFDYGWGDYESGNRPQGYARTLLRVLEERIELQQYIYDSGLIPRYAAFLRKTADEVGTNGDGAADVLSRVLVLKLLGHELYRDNSAAGPDRFAQALALVDDLDRGPKGALNGRAWLLPWYRVFFNDHYANDLSKSETFPDMAADAATAYGGHRDAALAALPKRLQAAKEMPRQEDLPLLIRAAHFWGHVGNQEGRIVASLRRPGNEVTKRSVQMHLKSGRQAYLRAALFRVAGYKTSFFPSRSQKSEPHPAFDRAVKAVLKLSSVEGAWLNEFVRADFADGPREHFMHPSQSLGDCAHQLIGAAKLHYEALAVLWNLTSVAERKTLRDKGDVFLAAGRALWSSTEALAQEEGSKLIQYYIWTVEEELLSAMTGAALSGAEALRCLPVDEEVNQRLKTILETRGISYPDAEKKIRKTIREVYAYLLRVVEDPKAQKN